MLIRRATPDDASAIAAIYAPFVRDSAVSFELDAPTAVAMRGRIAEISATYPWLVADDNGHIAGYVYASQHHARAAYQWAADVTAYLHPNHHRKGLGRRLYDTLFATLRTQGFHSAYAGITLPNDASVALHTAMGMSPVGVYREVGFKFGAWHDVLWMGVTFGNTPAPDGPPLPFSQGNMDILGI